MDLEDVVLGIGRLAMFLWWFGPNPDDMWAYRTYRTGRWGPWYRRMWLLGRWLWRLLLIAVLVLLVWLVYRL